MAPSLCGNAVNSRRALLASLWSIVTILTAIAFLTALTFATNTKQTYDDDYYYDQEEQNQYIDPEVAVTSRAMAFAAMWTAVLASLMTVFGTVVLGWQSPTGQYHTCCSSNVHRTTPLSLGSFIGALLMFANLTLVCSVLFGEFEIRDYQRDGDGQNGQDNEAAQDTAVERSSMAFSIMCMFLTVIYAGFAALTFSFSQSIIEEHADDLRDQALNISRNIQPHYNGYDGFIGERFDVVPRPPLYAGSTPGGFVSPTPNDVAALT